MYGRPVSKCHPRLEACGALDELNAALGVARATAPRAGACQVLETIQRDLIQLMGELATAPDDRARFAADGYRTVTAEWTAKLDGLIGELEAQRAAIRGWAIPGATPAAAALDLARTICRRAERRVCALHEAGQLGNLEVVAYLNRLSDLLWLLARREESRSATP